jgi:hypothetical protein
MLLCGRRLSHQEIMKILAWNIRGLNNPLKQKEVRRMVNSLKLSIICLVETRVQQANSISVVKSMLPGWNFFHNYSMHLLGKIWICWDPGIISLSLVDVHSQVTTCMVMSTTNKRSWFLSAVYGANQGLERRTLWKRLENLKFRLGDVPWILAGDLNAIRDYQEKWGVGGLSSYDNEFAGCISQLEVDDLAFMGCFHTWSNKQAGSAFVSKKLDRVLANVKWMQDYGSTSVDFLEAGVSDHSPALIVVERYNSFGPKPFKFFNFWADHSLFLDWVGEGWNTHVEGFSIYKLYTKLKVVKKILKAKNLEVFGGLGHRVLKAKQDLDRAQAIFIASHGNLDCLSHEKECLHAYVSLSLVEENFLKQKA